MDHETLIKELQAEARMLRRALDFADPATTNSYWARAKRIEALANKLATQTKEA